MDSKVTIKANRSHRHRWRKEHDWLGDFDHSLGRKVKVEFNNLIWLALGLI
jgi:hypothetical protein